MLSLGLLGVAHGRSLSEQLESLPTEAVHSAGEIPNVQTAETFTPKLLRLAVRGTDFPSTSTTPAFTYRYNPELGIFERSSGSLGPVFLERSETVGKGRFDIGVSYLYADLSTDNGDSIEGPEGSFKFIASIPGSGAAAPPGVQEFSHFSLLANVFDLSGTYGLTDRWDVNVLVPLIWTSLHVTAVSRVEGTALEPQGVADNKFGVGDILLRTKYRFTEGSPVSMAGGFVLRLPTGKATNFQGLGDATVEPLFIASTLLGPHDVHLNLGMEVDAQDVQRTRARYGVGATLQIVQKLAFLADIIGSSGLVDTSSQKVLAGNVAGLAPALGEGVTASVRGSNTVFDVTVPRSDIVDAALGFKVNVYGSAVGFVSAIVPLTTDGVRADVVPAGGFEFSF